MADTILTTTATAVPPQFPAAAYEGIHAHISVAHRSSPAFNHYLSAWSALAWRYQEALEKAEQFKVHFQKFGEGPAAPERYPQERMLFDFFSAAISCFETLFFAVHAIASKSQPIDFPMSTAKDLRAIGPAKVIERLKKHCAGDPVIGQLEALKNDTRYVELHDIRNVLTHRGAPGRHFRMEIGTGRPNPPATWDVTAQPLTADILKLAADDIASLLSLVMPAVQAFALAR